MTVINSKKLEKISSEDLTKEIKKLSDEQYVKLRQAVNKGE